MTNNIKPLLAVVFSLMLPVAGQSETTLTQAEITKIVRDVKTIDPTKGSHPATLKETVRGQQSVRTGLESRSELLFNDKTITRLGANTHFSFSEGTRNMSLDNGAILLQVPKGIGGARIETAAATAGITGTTILLEAARNYTKLIVLEGQCCLWPKSPNGKSHKICASAGEELIVIVGSKRDPDRLNVNLRVIENTSLLLTGKWGVTLNTGPLIAAANGQGSGYVSTNSGGAGADSITTLTKLPQTPPTTTTPPPPPTTTTTTTVTTPRTPPPPGNIR